MTVRELIERLQQVADLDSLVFVATPIPTEMGDCRVSSISYEPENHLVWILWPTEKAGSGMCIGDQLIATQDGLQEVPT